ncbi:MupA/Atu3671 family FMN-dependent luciferase-like monooxygenase [Scytonema sp. PCC 10023]|uniref:MupA/Atu3671 family FMN-dependent luciferase-like monooxygenase n=1 Tax=Scytonema sp. PCC 10023 TaxID=1680591 RepID=UPI0039C68DAA
MQFGLMFFASQENSETGGKYHLVIESAKFADQHGFSSVWLPERHFAAMGCLFPNPAVLNAALAMQTKRIRLRAGSVVLPLHHPIRIAEEWAMVDNLSQGRVEISFASGWHPNDFAFFPEKYPNRYEEMYQGIETVQKLWQGESIPVKSGNSTQIQVRSYPSPIQPVLPIWVTAASNPQTFAKAGEIGANLLTHLFDQSTEELAEKIALYRQMRAKHGHDPESGKVAVMLHTFVGEDVNLVREQVRQPFCDYLKLNQNLLKGLAQSRSRDVDLTKLSSQEFDNFLNFLFERFFSTRALIGTPDTCLGIVSQLKQAGIDEIACLLDFGPDNELILSNLPFLNKLQELCRTEGFNNSSAFKRQIPSKEATSSNSYLQNHHSSKLHDGFENLNLHSSSLQEIQARCTEEINVQALYKQIAEIGLQYGLGFQAIKHLYQREGKEALGQIQLPELPESEFAAYNIHPVFWDNCCLVFGSLLNKNSLTLSPEFLLLHIGYRRLEFYRKAGHLIWSHASAKNESGAKDVFEGDVRILNPSGELVAQIWGLRYQLVHKGYLLETTGSKEISLVTQEEKNNFPRSNALLAVPPEEREQFLSEYFREQVSKTFKLSVSQLDIHQSLLNVGLDSLIAIELRNKIETELGIVIPIVTFLQGLSIAQLVTQVLSSLTLETGKSELGRENRYHSHDEEEITI